MPKKKTDAVPTQPSVPSPESSSLSFTIETFDEPETGQPTQYGRFSHKWQDEEALDALIDKLEAGQLSHKQALMQARKLEATTPYNRWGDDIWPWDGPGFNRPVSPTSKHVQ
jgi:hypothetical protein